MTRSKQTIEGWIDHSFAPARTKTGSFFNLWDGLTLLISTIKNNRIHRLVAEKGKVFFDIGLVST